MAEKLRIAMDTLVNLFGKRERSEDSGLDWLPDKKVKRESAKQRRKSRARTRKIARGISALESRIPKHVAGPIPTFSVLLNTVHRIVDLKDPIPMNFIRVIVTYIASIFNGHLIAPVSEVNTELLIEMAFQNPIKSVFVKRIYDTLTTWIRDEAMHHAMGLPDEWEMLQKQPTLPSVAEHPKVNMHVGPQLEAQCPPQVPAMNNTKERFDEMMVRKVPPAMNQEPKEPMNSHETNTQSESPLVIEMDDSLFDEEDSFVLQFPMYEDVLQHFNSLPEATPVQKASHTSTWLQEVPRVYPFSQEDINAVKRHMEVGKQAEEKNPFAPRSYVCHLCAKCQTESVGWFLEHMISNHNLSMGADHMKRHLLPPVPHLFVDLGRLRGIPQGSQEAIDV